MSCVRRGQLISPGMTGSLKRAGAVRSGVVGCLTELGIVCFLAVSQARIACPPNRKAGKHYEACEGVPAAPDRTAPARAPRTRRAVAVNDATFFASEHSPA